MSEHEKYRSISDAIELRAFLLPVFNKLLVSLHPQKHLAGINNHLVS